MFTLKVCTHGWYASRVTVYTPGHVIFVAYSHVIDT